MTLRAGFRLALCGGLGMVASVGPALADFNDHKARLVAAIEAAGCIVHDRNEAAILRAARLTPGEGSRVVIHLMQTGQAVPSGENLRLKTGSCR